MSGDPGRALPGEAAVFRCGPRKGGNSDRAAALFTEGLALEGLGAAPVFLREHAVSPCLGCDACAKGPKHACPLAAEDDSDALFDHPLHAPFLCFASPIYFYHVPAIFKALIDRAQRFYHARAAGDAEMLALPGRRAYVILVAGRPSGERLFEGTLLTLKYFLSPFSVELAEPLLLRGLDGPKDLARDREKSGLVLAYGRDAARRELAG